MSTQGAYDFGIVDENGDFCEFHWSSDAVGECRLDLIIQTERGPRRTTLVIISTQVWTSISERTIRELAEGMSEDERTKKVPTLRIGINRLSPLIGRELAVLLWALTETAENQNVEAILHGWRELAREERWWLYSKCAAPGQRPGAGWRLALFHALSDTTDDSTQKVGTLEKKSLGNGSQSNKKTVSRSQLDYKECRKESKKQSKEQIQASNKKKGKSLPEADLKKREIKKKPGKKIEKVVLKSKKNN